MPYPSETYLNLIRTLGTAVPNEFESLYAQLEGWMSTQHKDDGSHGAVTADSLTVEDGATIGDDASVDGDLSVTGNITAQDGNGEQVDIGATVAVNPGISGARMRSSFGDWALGPLDASAGFCLADMLNTSVSNRRVLIFQATSAFGVPTTYALVPGNNGITQIDLGAYQTVVQSGGALRSVNAAEMTALTYYQGGGATNAIGHWDDYTPTFVSTGTQPTLGTGGTIAGRYSVSGKTVEFIVRITLGTGFSFGTGALGVTLPRTHTADSTNVYRPFQALYTDAGTSIYAGASARATIASAAVAGLFSLNWATGALGNLTTTAPFTWVATDVITVSGTFEEA